MDVLITPEIILKRINFSTGWKFERIISKILLFNGFTNIELTPETGDYGVDILAEKDDITYAVQCKCYLDPVGNKAVQEVYTGKAYYHKMVAVVITNNVFTKSAIKTAEETQVLLWDRKKLEQLIKALSQPQMQELADFMGIAIQQPEPEQEPQFLEQLPLLDDNPPTTYSPQTSQPYVSPQQSPRPEPLYLNSRPLYYKSKSDDYVKESYEKKQMLKEAYEKKKPEKTTQENRSSTTLYAFSYLHCSLGILFTIATFCSSGAWGITLLCTILCSPIVSEKIEKKIHSVFIIVIGQILLMCISLFAFGSAI
ncbi:MAG: restriction endonuclease [Oscillospiraceae bacterium]|nr:restriction endonuclease [Oscillospiraceae bacterium]